ncbi:MAG: SUMF1/EgtB/PvdO family nonheme iron enzyme [Anaerolineae bacterium]|nr:SUMF1/EgtB/PvdO family nonheme iron enzyme [Anaerolineae bacterium]
MSYNKKDTYLRRRTRDSGWQWMMIGAIFGLGFAAILCVGGYAIGAISFPALEDETNTPYVQAELNQTEIALQAMIAQQTLDAARQTLVNPPTSPAGDGSASPDAADTAAQITPTPSPLPDTSAQPADTLIPQPTQPAQAPADQGTPVVGTPPVGTPTQALSLPGSLVVPPELDAVKTDLVPVSGGTYLMGTTLDEAAQARDECALYGKTCDDYLNWVSDSIPPHQTTVDSFDIEIYEVSLTQYVAFLNFLGPNSHKSGCNGQPCAFTNEDEALSNILFDGGLYSVRNPNFYGSHPVTFVTWAGAQQYCQTLNRRLPTEAEWERAARGSQNNLYPWGFSFDPARAMSSVTPDPFTVPVDSYANGVSPYSVFNMAGNVSEWVYDWYQADYYNQQLNNPTPNPSGPVGGDQKVHRGGNWDTIPFFLRSVHRLSQPPGIPLASIGFRCAANSTSAVQPVAPAANTDTTSGDNAASGGAPTLAPPPTWTPLPTSTPAGPTATLAPE